jgi:quercetin dioxygenase-like cupin family protein
MQQHGKAVVIHANQRKGRVVPGNPVTYEELSPEGTESMEMAIARAAPGQSTGPKALEHDGDETLLVLSGQMELEVEDQRYTLVKGDSAFIPRGQRHRLTNIGTEPGEAVFVISPAGY